MPTCRPSLWIPFSLGHHGALSGIPCCAGRSRRLPVLHTVLCVWSSPFSTFQCMGSSWFHPCSARSVWSSSPPPTLCSFYLTACFFSFSFADPPHSPFHFIVFLVLSLSLFFEPFCFSIKVISWILLAFNMIDINWYQLILTYDWYDPRCFLLGRKTMTNVDSILKSRDIA